MNIQLLLNAISDPTRRKIIKLLKKNNLSAGEISSNFDISAPAISRHLAILQKANIVSQERIGKNIIYTLNISVIDEILLLLNSIFTTNNSIEE